MYEMQVRSRLADQCGQSVIWSEWSNPVTWGSNNGTGKITQMKLIDDFKTTLFLILSYSIRQKTKLKFKF